jgi:hypothetical protein
MEMETLLGGKGELVGVFPWDAAKGDLCYGEKD